MWFDRTPRPTPVEVRYKEVLKALPFEGVGFIPVSKEQFEAQGINPGDKEPYSFYMIKGGYNYPNPALVIDDIELRLKSHIWKIAEHNSRANNDPAVAIFVPDPLNTTIANVEQTDLLKKLESGKLLWSRSTQDAAPTILDVIDITGERMNPADVGAVVAKIVGSLETHLPTFSQLPQHPASR